MDLDRMLGQIVDGWEEYKVTLDILRPNVRGKIWMIGGSVFRNLAHRLYGSRAPHCDLDFLVEGVPDEFVLPSGVALRYNRYGGKKLVTESFSVDVLPINDVNSIRMRDLKPTVDNYLTGVPLTVQSIAFDVESRILLGEVGKKAILDKTVGVNCALNANDWAPRYGKSVREKVQEMADSLNFKAIL